MNYYRHSKNNGKGKKAIFALTTFVLLVGGIFWYFYSQYQYYLETPVSEGDMANVAFIIIISSLRD